MADRVIRWIITADSHGAIQNIQRVGTAAEGATQKLDQTGRAAQHAHGKLDALGSSTRRLRGSMGGLGGMVGLAGVAIGIKDVVKAGLTLQTQQASLQGALRSTGNASKQTMDRIMAAAQASSTHGGFDVPTELGGMTRFLTETHSVTKAVQENAAVTDVARRLHTDYGSALSIVARAQVGATGKLQQYLGIIIPVTSHVHALTAAQKKANPAALDNAKILDKQATAAMVNARIIRSMSGATSDYSNTTQGALSNAKNAYESLKGELGLAFLPIVKKVAIGMEDVAKWMEKHKTLAKILVGVLAGLTGAYVLGRVVINSYRTATEAWAIVMRTRVPAAAATVEASDAAIVTANDAAAASFRRILVPLALVAAAIEAARLAQQGLGTGLRSLLGAGADQGVAEARTHFPGARPGVSITNVQRAADLAKAHDPASHARAVQALGALGLPAPHALTGAQLRSLDPSGRDLTPAQRRLAFGAARAIGTSAPPHSSHLAEGKLVIEATTTPILIDARHVAEIVTNYALRMRARR